MALSEEEKVWLMEHEEEIAEHLDPEKTIRYLKKKFPEEFDSRDVENILKNHQTSHDRTEALCLLLLTRSEDALRAFRQAATILHPVLGPILQPVVYSVLWVCPSAQHAAMAVHLLERFKSTEFVPPEDGGLQFLVRRSIGGALGHESAAVKLVFPVRPELFPEMLGEVVRESESVDLVMMTGQCEALVAGLPAGQVVVPSSACGGEGGSSVHSQGAERVGGGLRERLRERLRGAPWRDELEQLFGRHAYMDYCSAWLGRLHVELTASSERCRRSVWLERLGWREGGLGEKANRDILACHLPVWETGELARHLLRGTRRWKVDPSSPLGLSPTPDTASHLSERVGHFETFPELTEETAPAGPPVLKRLSPPGGGGGGEVADPSTHQFYKACSECLGSGSTWLASLCVCYDKTIDNHELTAFTAITMAMEIVQMLMSRELS